MYINIEELEKFLLKINTKKFIVRMKGLVNTTIFIEEMNLLSSTDKIWFVNKNKKILSVNKHQIMKINIDNQNVIQIKLDQLLNIYIVPCL